MNNNATFLSFEDHLRKLRGSIPGIRISYRPGYDDKGPCIGIRGAIGDITGDMIRIDDTMWLIAGDIYKRDSRKEVRSMREMQNATPFELYVQMRGQAMAAGGLVSIELGTYDIVELNYLNEDLGFAILSKDK